MTMKTPPMLNLPNGHKTVRADSNFANVANFSGYCAPNRTSLSLGLKCGGQSSVGAPWTRLHRIFPGRMAEFLKGRLTYNIEVEFQVSFLRPPSHKRLIAKLAQLCAQRL